MRRLSILTLIVASATFGALISGPGSAAAVVQFNLEGSLTNASPPFTLTDAVSGNLVIADAAAAPGYVSTDPQDILSFSFTIGEETWTGTGDNFQGIFQFEISGGGQELFFKNAGGGLSSFPGDFFLDIVTNDPNPTEWFISSVNGQFGGASAVNTMRFLTPAPIDCVDVVAGDCPGSGGALFALRGNLTTANEPFTLGDPVEGCFRVETSTATPGYVSVDPLDVLNYSFTIGSQTWTGTGADFQGIFRFEISQGGQELYFKDAGGNLGSFPGGYALDIVTNDPNPTEWLISGGPFLGHIAAANGTMGFCLVQQPVSVESRGWGSVKTLYR